MEISRPNAPAMIPLTGALPLKEPTMAMPTITSMKNSGGPSQRTSGRKIGMAANNTIAPMMPPMAEDVKAADSARAASPFFAIG